MIERNIELSSISEEQRNLVILEVIKKKKKVLGDIHKVSGCGPGQPILGNSAGAGWLNKMATTDPF